MGKVISLESRRVARDRESRPLLSAPERFKQATFFFDLACPFTYLAAERVDRFFPHVEWVPATSAVLHGNCLAADPAAAEAVAAKARRRACELRLPLQLPEHYLEPVPAAMRVACLAAERGRAAPFVLAAGRLAFCGGYDLDDPEALTEAAAAADLGLDQALAAAGDVSHDGPMEEAARRLLAAGADRLPALRVGRVLVWGEDRITDVMSALGTAASAAAHAPARAHPTR